MARSAQNNEDKNLKASIIIILRSCKISDLSFNFKRSHQHPIIFV